MSTAERVQQYLETHCKVFKRGDNWRTTSPLRQHSDSDSFSVMFDGPEHGAYKDHVSEETGSLYDLARALGIGPDIAPAEDTHRAFDTLQDYAVAHGVTEAVLIAAGWSQTTYSGRPAIAIPTANGIRHRFLDDGSQRWTNPAGYTKCWYGLERAVKLATQYRVPLIICNGEPSTVVAQSFGVPGCAVTSGEGAIPEHLLDELRRAWDGRIVIAMDCDEKGEAAAAKIAKQLPHADVVDLKLSKGGDLADFCKLHGNDSRAALVKRLPRQTLTQKPSGHYTDAAIAEVITNMATPGAIRGFRTGLPSFDRLTSGLQRERMYVLYGDTGMGKSTLMTTMLPYLAECGPVLVDSTETPPRPYLMKVACGMISTTQSAVTFDMLEDGTLTVQQYEAFERAMYKLAALPIVFLDTPPTADGVVDEVQYAIRNSGIGVYLVDSISNINGHTDDVYRKTVEAADALMNAARLNIAVVTTSQVGRNLKDRSNKKPTLHDAQGGGRIEQNADSVWSVYRHHYYVEREEAQPLEGFGPNTTALTCLKDRWRGKIGRSVRLQMVGGSRFHEQIDEDAIA